MNPAETQVQYLAKQTFPPNFCTAALAAVSLEAEALAVTYINSGKELNYIQLLKHLDYTKEWRKSSSNEFDRLGDGRTRRVKGTDTIFSLHPHEVPQNRKNTQPMGFSNAMSNLINRNQTKPASLLAETESITLETLTHRQLKYCSSKSFSTV